VSLSVIAAAVVLVVAAGIITGNLLAAAQIGETVEMLILVAAVVAAVLAAAVLVGAARAAEPAVARAEVLAGLGETRATTTKAMETIRAIQTRTTPARAAAITARGKAKAERASK
jgi:hypothetical protein